MSFTYHGVRRFVVSLQVGINLPWPRARAARPVLFLQRHPHLSVNRSIHQHALLDMARSFQDDAPFRILPEKTEAVGRYTSRRRAVPKPNLGARWSRVYVDDQLRRRGTAHFGPGSLAWAPGRRRCGRPSALLSP